MKVYFHLGMHKTGSSLLQQMVFPKYKRGYYVPRKDSNELKKYIQYTDDFEFDPKVGRDIFNKIKEVSDHQTIIISDEELYGNPYWSTMDRKRNIDRITAIFENDVFFLLFIRNQSSLLDSLYNQYVKTGGTANFDSFLQFKKYPLYVNIGYFLYDKYIAYIQSCVGVSNVKVFLFEDFLNRKVEIVNEISNFLNCEALNITDNDFTMVNPSLKNNFLPFLRFNNKLTKSPKNPFNLLPRLFQRAYIIVFLKLDFLPLGERKNKFIDIQVLDQIKKSNNSLLENSGLDLRKYHYPL